MLVSHTEVNFRVIEFQSQQLKVAGISAVFTYPAFRGSGCASQIVTEALALAEKGGHLLGARRLAELKAGL